MSLWVFGQLFPDLHYTNLGHNPLDRISPCGTGGFCARWFCPFTLSHDGTANQLSELNWLSADLLYTHCTGRTRLLGSCRWLKSFLTRGYQNASSQTTNDPGRPCRTFAACVLVTFHHRIVKSVTSRQGVRRGPRPSDGRTQYFVKNDSRDSKK